MSAYDKSVTVFYATPYVGHVLDSRIIRSTWCTNPSPRSFALTQDAIQTHGLLREYALARLTHVPAAQVRQQTARARNARDALGNARLHLPSDLDDMDAVIRAIEDLEQSAFVTLHPSVSSCGYGGPDMGIRAMLELDIPLVMCQMASGTAIRYARLGKSPLVVPENVAQLVVPRELAIEGFLKSLHCHDDMALAHLQELKKAYPGYKNVSVKLAR